MNNLEKQLNNEILHEKDSKSALSVIKVQFDKFIHSEMLKSSNYDSNAREARQDFKEYTQMEAQSFKYLIIQHMESIEQCIVERVKATDASSGDTKCSGIVSDKRNDQVEKVDSNVIPDLPDICDNDIQSDQNAEACDNERVALANLISAILLLRRLIELWGESNSTRDSCLIALQSKQTELETYMTLNDRTVDYDKLELVKEKHDELVKQSFLTKSHYKGLVKEKTTVITDLKLKEEKDIDKMISMKKQLKFLNAIGYKRNKSIQTIHMLAPKGSTFNGRPTFANPMYLKKTQSEKPYMYEIPYDTSDLANKFTPDRKETLTLKKLVDQTWEKHSHDHFRAPTAHDMEIIIKTCLMPLALKTHNDSFKFVHEIKQEMHADLKYVESLEKEIDELESDKAKILNIYDILLQECVSNDVMCSYLHSLSDLDAHTELQCLYQHKIKECECLAEKLSKQTEIEARKRHKLQKDKDLEIPNLVMMEILSEPSSNKLCGRGSYALHWKPCQRDSSKLKPPDHSPIPAKSDSLPHAHAQVVKTYYWHQDSRIKKAQEFKIRTFANSDIQDLPFRYQVYQGRLLASFQDDAKYEHVGQDRKIAKTLMSYKENI
ncbi:hypothetical protein Tco_1174091 [Tanacetum coccineum]